MRTHRTLTSRLTMWSILLFLGSVLMGVGVFMVTQAARQHEAGIENINRSLLAERQSIRVLEAEWAYLARPQRLEELMAMREEDGVLPPLPAPIATVVSAEEPQQADVATTEPAAGTQSIAVVKPEPEAAPASKKDAPAKPEVVKAAAKSTPKKAASVDVWPIEKRQPVYRAPAPAPVYRAASSARPGMRPIVE